jgi:hypothetical protein
VCSLQHEQLIDDTVVAPAADVGAMDLWCVTEGTLSHAPSLSHHRDHRQPFCIRGLVPALCLHGACIVLAWCLHGACMVLAWCLHGACMVLAHNVVSFNPVLLKVSKHASSTCMPCTGHVRSISQSCSAIACMVCTWHCCHAAVCSMCAWPLGWQVVFRRALDKTAFKRPVN